MNANYLDLLFDVYPVQLSNPRRELMPHQVEEIISSYNNHDDLRLLNILLDLEVFPIKYAYIATLREDREAITRNPEIVSRIINELYNLGIDEILNRCSAPKESNRQISKLFKQWVGTGTLGLPVLLYPNEFLRRHDNCILNSSDKAMKQFAAEYLGFTRDKGIDFLARVNGKYIVGEAKFLTSEGGNQNNQFYDAISSMHSFSLSKFQVIPIAILDGVLYLHNHGKIYEYLSSNQQDNIMSALLLREFLYSL